MYPMNLYYNKKYGTYSIRFSRQEMPPAGKLISLRNFVGRPVSDKEEAQEVLRIVKKKWLQGKLIELDQGKRVPLDKFRKEYLANRRDKSSGTLRLDSLALRSLGDVLGQSITLKAITAKQIARFKTASLARGLSPVSLNTYLRHIRAALNQAQEWEYIQKVPVAKNVEVPKGNPRILTKNEIGRILDYTKKNDYEMWRIVQFTLWTGTRRGETHSANWRNVRGKTIQIVGKGNKMRTIPLLPRCIEAMGELRDIGPIFIQCHIDNYTKWFKAIARAVGIEDIKFHNLRHSAASYMIQSGMHPNAVQEIMGHSDFRTTQIYIKLHPEFLEQELEKLRF